MTFWQENYGFVKDVYDFRLQKYQEWMDNLEAIVAKVMAPNVQYTYKEFKIIQDTLGSLTRDLEKEGMKEWLDMMLEKVAMRVSDEGPISAKDKEFKLAEKKKLQALIDRHTTLMPSTQETQAKVEIYSRCYAFGDDISPVLKTLEEMRHLACKEIHPHNMNMVEEQIDKAQKVINTVEAQKDQFEELMKRGKKLLNVPNCAPFLSALLEKLETTWKEANVKSHERLNMLSNSAKDWEKYDEQRSAINAPIENLEKELKHYRKYFDPVMGAKKLAQKKGTWEENKKVCDDMMETIKKCYQTIVVLAGTDKKEFLDREVGEVEEKRKIITTCDDRLKKLFTYNDTLTKAVNDARALRDWQQPNKAFLNDIVTSTTMSPEERVKEILTLQEQARERMPLVDPLAKEYRALFTEEELEKSDTAKGNLAEWEEIKAAVTELCTEIEKEAGNISQDQRFYADYMVGIRDFKPWLGESETKAKTPLPKPETIDDAFKLLEDVQVFDANCLEEKAKLEAASQARDSMEKPSNTENEVEPLTGRWDAVKKITAERVEKVKVLVETWGELKKTTDDLAVQMNEVAKQEEPKLDDLEKTFATMKELFAKKKELLANV